MSILGTQPEPSTPTKSARTSANPFGQKKGVNTIGTSQRFGLRRTDAREARSGWPRRGRANRPMSILKRTSQRANQVTSQNHLRPERGSILLGRVNDLNLRRTDAREARGGAPRRGRANSQRAKPIRHLSHHQPRIPSVRKGATLKG